MRSEMQLSGIKSGYKLRFITAANALEKALDLLGCETCEDGTGMAYVVIRNNMRIGGPASCKEHAMASAVSRLTRERS